MNQSISLNQSSELATEGKKLLTFTLGAEEYGIDLLRIQEIKGYLAITPIPNTAPWIKGVINLRGNVIPVVDLRLRFGKEQAEYTRFTVIIVVTLGARVVGLIVDAVSDVMSVPHADIQTTPELASNSDSALLTGLVRVGERLVLLLDLDGLLVTRELTQAESAV